MMKNSKLLFTILTVSNAVHDHTYHFNLAHLCQESFCSSCERVIEIHAANKYSTFCSNLLMVPNCCGRYFGHTGSLVPSREEKITIHAKKSTIGIHACEIVAFAAILILTLFLLRSFLKKFSLKR